MKFVAFSSIPAVLRQRAGLMRPFLSHASSHEVLHPPEQTYSPAAIYLDDEDLKRIASAAEFFPLELEWQRMRGGPGTSGEIRLHKFKNALLLGGDLFLHGSRMRLRGGSSHALHLGSVPEVAAASLSSTQLGSQFFGHWLLDDIPRFAQLSALGAGPFLVGGPPSQHQQEYMATLGISGPIRSDAFFSSLGIVQDGSMQSYKSRQLAEMRDCIRSAGTAPSRSAGVMLLRGGSGRRRILVNETELAGALSARGFKIIDPMKTTVSDIASACAVAEIVVGVEGSHMVHAVLALAPDTSFITIQPPFKFDNTCKPYCDALGIKYAFTVGHPSEGGFSVEFDRVLRIIDKTVAAQCRKASYAQ